jgi:hypothetical protein
MKNGGPPALHDCFDQSEAPFCNKFHVGGVSVQLAGESAEDVALVSSLEAFRAEPGGFDIHVRVEWINALPASLGRQLFDSGTTWRLYEDDNGFQFDFIAAILGDRPLKRLLIDEQFRLARIQMSEECAATLGNPLSPLGYPLDELLIMHRLTQERAIELHGSGIVRANGVGNLFVGHSGAGKSTTTRLWTEREEVEVLSDDRIIVRLDEEVEIPCRAADTTGGDGVLRLREGSASRNHRFAQDDRTAKEFHSQDDNRRGMRMYGTPWHGEAMFASPNSAPLTRIFVLEHGHGNVITRLSRSQAVSELFARSFVPFHRHEYIESALSFLEQLTDSVPCYRYSFEPDRRAVEEILQFTD